MQIRRAEYTDLASVLALYGELAGPYSSINKIDSSAVIKRWEEIKDDNRQHLLVADIDGQVAGTLNLTIIPNLGHGGQPWAAIDNVAVAPEQRGQGIGEKLVAEAGRIAKEHNCYKIILSSNIARERAHEFYRRLGWRETHIGFSLETDR